MLRKLPRRLGYVVAILLLLIFAAGYGLPALLSTDAFHARVASTLGSSLGRPVTLGDVDIAPFFSSVDLENVTVGNPPGWPRGSLLEADHLQLDVGLRALLRRDVVGRLDGERLRVTLLRRGESTNLEGLGGAEESKTPAKETKRKVNLDLTLALRDSRLVVKNLDDGSVVTLDGVGLDTRVTDRAGVSESKLDLTIATVDQSALRLRDVRLDAVRRGNRLDVGALTAKLAKDGALKGKGNLDTATLAWNVDFDAKDVELDAQIRPVLGAIFPFAAGAPGDPLSGRGNATFGLRGRGLDWVAVRPTLSGHGDLSLQGVALPEESVTARIAALAGRPGALSLREGSANLKIDRGWIDFGTLRAVTKDDLRIDLEGRVSLTGDLALKTDLLPLVERIDAGPFRAVAGRVERLPVRIGGTVTHPKIDPPKAEDVPVDGKVLKDVFGRIRKPKQK